MNGKSSSLESPNNFSFIKIIHLILPITNTRSLKIHFKNNSIKINKNNLFFNFKIFKILHTDKKTITSKF